MQSNSFSLFLLYIFSFICAVSTAGANTLIPSPLVGGENDLSYNANVLAVSQDGDKVVFYSDSTDIPGYTGPEIDISDYLVFIKNVEDNSVSLLSQTQSGTIADDIDTFSFSEVTDNNSVFFDYYGDDALKGFEGERSKDGVRTNSFRLDLSTGQITPIHLPDRGSHRRNLNVTQNEYLYYYDWNDGLQLSIDLGTTWSAVESECWYTFFNLVGSSSNGRLLYDCGGRSYRVYDPVTEAVTRVLITNTPPHSGFIDNDNIDLSGDGKLVIYTIGNAIYQYELETATTKRFDLSEYYLDSASLLNVDNDGSQVVITAASSNHIIQVDDITEYSGQERGLFYLDLNTRMAPKRINVFEQSMDDGTRIFRRGRTPYRAYPYDDFSAFAFTINSTTETSIEYQSYTIDIKDIVDFQFRPTNTEVELNVTNNGPHKNSVTASALDNNHLYRIERHSERTDDSDIFWLEHNSYEDYEFGLQNGVNNYTVALCNYNLVCTESITATQSITTQDFEENTSWDLNISNTASSYSGRLTARVSNIPWEQKTLTKARLYHSANVSTISGIAAEYHVPEEADIVKIGLQPCVINRLLNSDDICSEIISIKSHTLPKSTPISVLLSRDYKSTSVHFNQEVGYTYNIERGLDGGGFELIAENINTQWRDTSIRSGLRYFYRLQACDADICRSGQSKSAEIKRTGALLVSRVNTTDTSVSMALNAKLEFDSIVISRTDGSTDFQEIAILPATESEFIDEGLIPRQTYYYQVKAMVGEETVYETSLSRRTDGRSFDLLAKNYDIANLSLDSSFAYGHLLNWDPVDGATGYRVEVRNNDSWYGEAFTVEDPSVSEFFHSFSFELPNRNSPSYFVSALHKECADCQPQNGANSKISGQQLDFNFAEAQLYPSIFSVSQSGLNTVNISFPTQYLDDYYRIYRKAPNENDWQFRAFFAANSSQISFNDDVATIENGTSLQYKVEFCSFTLKRCASRESTGAFEVINEQFTGIPNAPGIEYSNEQFAVTLDVSNDKFVRFAELEASWGDSHETSWHIEDPYQVYTPNRRWNMETGDTVQFKVRYCFHRSGWPHYEDENCTDYSENTEIVLEADQTEITRQPRISSFYSETDQENLTVTLNIRLQDNDIYDLPTSLELYKAIGNADYQLLTAVEVPKDGSAAASYTDSEIETGEFYQYLAIGCNSAGCSQQQEDVFSIRSHEALPTTPRITSISAGEFIDQITLRFQPFIDGVHYIGYRATDPDGEFEEFARSWWDTYFIDRNIEGATTYFYRVDACNDNGCTPSEVVSGSTSAMYYTGAIQISGASLQQETDNAHSVVHLHGTSKAIHGYLDAFSGEIDFNQWLDITEGFESKISARLEGDWSECFTLLQWNLKIPGIRSRSQSMQRQLGRIIYTGNGCSDQPELDLFTLYFASDYLTAPVVIDSRFRESWTDFSLQLNSEGRFELLINGEQALQSETEMDMNIFGFTKLNVASNRESWHNEGTFINNIELIVNKVTLIEDSSLMSHHSPGFTNFHPRNIALQIHDFATAQAEYAFLNSDGFTPQELILTTGGKYNGYIENLRPGTEYGILMRKCNNDDCGPFEYFETTTRGYSEISRFPWMHAGISGHYTDVEISFWQSGDVVDQYTVYRRIEGEQEEVEVANFSIEDIKDHLLTNNYSYSVTDAPGAGVTANYSVKLCNPIGCYREDNRLTIDIPDDSDGDGVLDPYDAFPDDPNESEDTDGDGIGNNADTDDDNDGIPDDVEIELGLDPLSSADAFSDIDGDGFNNILEMLVGSDLGDSKSTPANPAFGIYTSFETPGEEFVLINNGNRVASDGYGNYSIEATFMEPGRDNLSFTVMGKLNDGYIIFSEQFSYSRLLAVYINGQAMNLEPLPFKYLGHSDTFWNTYAFPVKATEELATIEFVFNGFGDFFPTTINIDRLFLPVSPAERIGKNNATADFDGDGKTDVAARNGKLGRNYVVHSHDNEMTTVDFGRQENDIQVTGDFDGDGLTDIAVRRPSNSHWYVRNSSGSNFNSNRGDGIQRVTFGRQADDIPVPADYDGDGVTDFAVRRVENRTWYIRNSSGNNYNSAQKDGIQRIKFGLQEEDIPVPADYDGDGFDDIAFRRPSNSTWYILESTTGEIRRVKFGLQATDIPVPADYDGDGKTDIAVRRAANSMWYILQSSDETIQRIRFGLQETDIPVVGDYDGDGKADVAFRRNANATWYARYSSNEEIQRIQFGESEELVPLLAPIWEKLLRVGWEHEFLFSGTSYDAQNTREPIEGRVEQDEIFETTNFLVHPEYQGTETLLSEESQ